MGLFDGLRDELSFLGGFKVTLEQMARTRVTWQYPIEKKPKPIRQHGRHVLNRYEDGMEKCIGCELCAGVCPADCIYVRGADNEPANPVSPGERYGFVYEINYLRCIHCDMCVEACPTEAITESKLFEFSFTNRADAIYTKDELLVGDDGRPRQLPWEDWRAGDDLHTSGWMRATSPSGVAAYEGRVQWSGELGYGVRAPEGGQSPNRDDAATGTRQLREAYSAHLTDWERLPDQRGPRGVANRMRAKMERRLATLPRPKLVRGASPAPTPSRPARAARSFPNPASVQPGTAAGTGADAGEHPGGDDAS